MEGRSFFQDPKKKKAGILLILSETTQNCNTRLEKSWLLMRTAELGVFKWNGMEKQSLECIQRAESTYLVAVVQLFLFFFHLVAPFQCDH